MNGSIRWILALVLLMSFASLACGVFSLGDEPTAVPEIASTNDSAEEIVAEPTLGALPSVAEVPEEGEATGPSDEEDSIKPEEGVGSESNVELDLSTLSREFDFESYRFMLSMTFDGTDSQGNLTNQRIDGEIAYLAEPLSMQMSLSIEGVEDAAEFGDFSMAQIGETTYIVVSGFGCMTSSASDGNLIDDNPLSELIDPDEVLDGISGARRIGEETVNGIPTIVYKFDETFLEEDQDMDRVDGTIYVARNGNYVVRLVMDGEGSFNPLDDVGDSTGETHLVFELTEVNQPLEIGIPAECDADAAGGLDLPMLEDATEVTSFAGFLSYQSQETIETAVSYYDETLSSLGWVKDEASSVVTTGSAIIYFESEDELITLFIGEDSDNGGISVTISSAGGG